MIIRTTKILVTIVALITFTSLCFGFSASSDYAYSYGMNYKTSIFDIGEIDTSVDATNAASDFGLAGYSSYYNTSPTWSYVNGDNPNTNDNRIRSQIFFFSGHGTGGRIFFNYKSKDEDEYKFHITTNFVQSTSYHSLKLSDYELSPVKLMTFAACNSANNGSGSQGNLLDTAIASGAKTAVGWSQSIYASDHTKWLKRYTNELALGKTVKESVDYANGFSDYKEKSSVTATVIKGDANLKIKLSSASASNTILASQYNNTTNDLNIYKDDFGNIRGISFSDTATEDLTYNLNEDNLIKIKKLLSNYCNIEIDEFSYLIDSQKVDENYSIIRYTQTIEGIETNSEIIVNIRDNKISSIFNNIKQITADKDIFKKSLKSGLKAETKKSKSEKISRKDYIINQSYDKIYFDCDKNKLIYSLYFDTKKIDEGYDNKFIFEYDAIDGTEITD